MSQPTVLVVSAGGHTGLPTVLELLHRGYPVRALVHRDDARAERLRQHGAQVVVGSLDDPIDVTGALAGVQRAYFAPPFAPGALRVSSIFAEAADAARLEVIVALSLWLAHPTHPSVHAREDWLAVQRFAALPDTGVVTVNPGWFADNYMAGLTMAAQLGLFAMPLGEGRNAPPSNEDIARVIVGALADPAPHLGRALRPTGPALLTPGEIAATFGRVMGHRVRYLDTRPALFAKVMRAFGFPDYVSASVLTFLEEYRRDTFAIRAPTDVVERVGGRPPEDFETIVRRYVAAAPSGRRSPGGLVRMLGTFARVLATRAPDVDAVARTCGVGNRDHAVLAVDSAEWRATHGPATDTAAAHGNELALVRAS